MKTFFKNTGLAIVAVFAVLLIYADADERDQRLAERENAAMVLRQLEAEPMEVLTGVHYWKCGKRCEVEK